MNNLSKFEYLIIYSYINKNNAWVVNYLDNELSINLLPALFCELGLNGWELVNTSTHIEGEVVNRALLPINAVADVGISNTTKEIFYFKRVVVGDIQILKNFNREVNYIRSLTKEYDDKLVIDNKNSLELEHFIEKIEKAILLKGFQKISVPIDCELSFYKKDKTELINKGLFGNQSKKELTLEKRVDLLIEKDKIVYKYFEKVENNTWVLFEHTEIIPNNEEIENFINTLN